MPTKVSTLVTEVRQHIETAAAAVRTRRDQEVITKYSPSVLEGVLPQLYKSLLNNIDQHLGYDIDYKECKYVDLHWSINYGHDTLVTISALAGVNLLKHDGSFHLGMPAENMQKTWPHQSQHDFAAAFREVERRENLWRQNVGKIAAACLDACTGYLSDCTEYITYGLHSWSSLPLSESIGDTLIRVEDVTLPLDSMLNSTGRARELSQAMSTLISGANISVVKDHHGGNIRVQLQLEPGKIIHSPRFKYGDHCVFHGTVMPPLQAVFDAVTRHLEPQIESLPPYLTLDPLPTLYLTFGKDQAAQKLQEKLGLICSGPHKDSLMQAVGKFAGCEVTGIRWVPESGHHKTRIGFECAHLADPQLVKEIAAIKRHRATDIGEALLVNLLKHVKSLPYADLPISYRGDLELTRYDIPDYCARVNLTLDAEDGGSKQVEIDLCQVSDEDFLDYVEQEVRALLPRENPIDVKLTNNNFSFGLCDPTV